MKIKFNEKTNLEQRIRRYMAKIPPAIAGQGGHNSAMRAAGVPVNGFNLAESDALKFTREWNQTYQPRWSESKLARKLSEALRTGTKGRG
jgi:hypothetical protein